MKTSGDPGCQLETLLLVHRVKYLSIVVSVKQKETNIGSLKTISIIHGSPQLPLSSLSSYSSNLKKIILLQI